MNNFTKRALTGAVYVALTVFCLLFSMDTAFLYIFIINLFSLYEFIGLTNPDAKKAARIAPLLVSGLLFVQLLIGFDSLMFPGDLEGMILVLMFAVLFYQIFTKTKTPFQYLGSVFLAWFYITYSLVLLLRTGINYDKFVLSTEYYNGRIVLAIFILIWASDTFAYLAGRAFGKHKLAPSISPGKTIEGAIGGFVGTLGVGWALFELWGDFRLLDYLIIAAIAFIFGLMGDLLVSRLKRSLGVKDSGNLLPGHGGFLDRFDSILIAGPMIYFYLRFAL